MGKRKNPKATFKGNERGGSIEEDLTLRFRKKLVLKRGGASLQKGKRQSTNGERNRGKKGPFSHRMAKERKKKT